MHFLTLASAADYTSGNKPGYNNFFWQANASLKPAGTATVGSAAVQGLVYNKLEGNDKDNSTGDLLDRNGSSTTVGETTTISGNPLPHFSTSWINDSSHTERQNLIKYYDKEYVNDKEYKLTFPFYETYSALNENTGTVKVGVTDSNSSSNNEVARFYQFDSREANLKFNIDNTVGHEHAGYFSETTGASNSDIFRPYSVKNGDTTTYYNSVKSDRSNVGFFPFNATHSATGSRYQQNNHNLGFGTKFEISFQLEKDGCVSPVKYNSTTGQLETIDTTTRIHTVFEFSGDDDLWVFIDGNLVLDMGGDHNRSTGRIDFADQTVTVDRAITYGTAGDQTPTRTAGDDLSAPEGTDPPSAATITSSSSPTFLSLLSGDNFSATNPGKYDTNETHTMTIFYMERGMLDSNLMIRYNYSPIANTSRMKIAEATFFDGVNDGLMTVTKQAAEGDVFKYHVTNTYTGSNPETPLDSSAHYPTLTTVKRTAESNSNWETTLTPNGTGSTSSPYLFNNGSSGVETAVANTNYWWGDGFSDTDYMVGRTTQAVGGDSGGDLWLMYGTSDQLYGDSKRGVESSAEFEMQFTRGSTMKVLQGDHLYRLPARTNGATSLYSGATLQATEDSDRETSKYYTTTYNIVDRAGNSITRNADGTFIFNNDTTKVNTNLAVMLTEYFKNTFNVGAISVTKTAKAVNGTVENGVQDTFTFKLTLTDVFGTDVDVSDYSGIKAKKNR